MVDVRQAVPHGYPGPPGQLLDHALPKPPELDAVEHPSQHPGRILHVLLAAEVNVVLAQKLGVPPLVDAGDREGAPGTGRGLLEKKRHVLPRQSAAPDSGAFLRLEVRRKAQQIGDFLGRKIHQSQKASSLEIDRHATFPLFPMSPHIGRFMYGPDAPPRGGPVIRPVRRSRSGPLP